MYLRDNLQSSVKVLFEVMSFVCFVYMALNIWIFRNIQMMNLNFLFWWDVWHYNQEIFPINSIDIISLWTCILKCSFILFLLIWVKIFITITFYLSFAYWLPLVRIIAWHAINYKAIKIPLKFLETSHCLMICLFFLKLKIWSLPYWNYEEIKNWIDLFIIHSHCLYLQNWIKKSLVFLHMFFCQRKFSIFLLSLEISTNQTEWWCTTHILLGILSSLGKSQLETYITSINSSMPFPVTPVLQVK